MWVSPETKDPVLLHHPTRQSVRYFGAVRLRDGKFIFQRQEDPFNGDTFFAFLKKLRQASCHAGRRVVVSLDNVSYHHARVHKKWRHQAAPRFALQFLPPYSPELNCIERVWKLTCRLATHNQYFPTLDATVLAVEDLFTPWHSGSETLRKLCAIT